MDGAPDLLWLGWRTTETTEADPYGMTKKKQARTRTTATTKQIQGSFTSFRMTTCDEEMAGTFEFVPAVSC
jgi:hypothetical protein